MQPHFASSIRKNVGPAAKRAVAHLQAVLGLSERRAYSIMGENRKMILSLQPPAGRSSAWPIARLANERRRFGYRRLFVLLRREGEPSGANRIYRLYRDEGLTVRKRWPQGRSDPGPDPGRGKAKYPLVAGLHPRPVRRGRRFRILNIVDDVTKECLGAIPDASISGRRVARELTAIVERRRRPGMIVSDHGSEFTCNAMLAWCKDACHIAPGS